MEILRLWKILIREHNRIAVEIKSFIFKITKEQADEILDMDEDKPLPRVGLICEYGAIVEDTAGIIVEYDTDGNYYVASKDMIIRGPDKVFCYLRHDVNEALFSDDLPKFSDIFNMGDLQKMEGQKMKVTLSIKKYIGWIWIIERNIDIRKEYKKLSDIPLTFLPRFVFINESEFDEAVKICGSTCSEEGMDNLANGKDVDIEWLDDFDYQAKLDMYQKRK